MIEIARRFNERTFSNASKSRHLRNDAGGQTQRLRSDGATSTELSNDEDDDALVSIRGIFDAAAMQRNGNQLCRGPANLA
jgi:hypothetical protein